MNKINPWRLASQQAIDNAIASTPSGENLKQAIDGAYPFGMRENLPYKIWLEERRKVLFRLGLYEAPANRICKYHPNGQSCLFCKS